MRLSWKRCFGELLRYSDGKWKSTKISLAIQNDNCKTVNPSALAGMACQTRFGNPLLFPQRPENSAIVITDGGSRTDGA